MNEIIIAAEGQFDKMAGGIQTVCAQALAIAPRILFPREYDVTKHKEGQKAYLEADTLLAEINRAYQHVEEKRKELTRPLDEVKSKIMEAAKLKTEPLMQAKETLRRTMGSFAMQEEGWAASERRRKEAEERKKREDERIAQAVAVADAGNSEAADELMEAPVAVRPQSVATANDTAKSSRRKVWKVEITDPKAFVKAWLEGKAPSGAIAIDSMMLQRITVAQKGVIDWPGVRAYEEIVIGSGR